MDTRVWSHSYTTLLWWASQQLFSTSILLTPFRKGTGISVFGTIPNIGRGTSPSSSYSVDGSTSGSFTGTQRSDVQYKVVFFQSSTLSAGDHTLVVTNVGNATGLLYIDFFQIVENDPSTTSPGTTVTVTSTPPPPPPPPPPPSPSAHPSPSSLSRSASPQTTSTPTPSNSLVESSPTDGPSLATITVTSSTSSNSSVVASTSSEHVRSTSAIGVVVGCVLGGLFVLGLFAFLFLYFIRRSRKARLPLAQNNGRGQFSHF